MTSKHIKFMSKSITDVELPPEPWHTIHVDNCGPFPTGEYLLVAIDAYSRFPVVKIVQTTSAKNTLVS